MSIALPNLASQARALGCVHALLHACAHRAVHFHSPYYVNGEAFLEGNRLIWLYDVRLLAGALERAGWSSFVELARGHGVSAICRDALAAAVNVVGAEVPRQVLAALEHPAKPEISAQLLSGGTWRAIWVELCAQRDASAQLQFLRKLLFPSRDYMLRRYPGRNSSMLPWLYVQRMLEGVHRRIRYFR